MVAVDIVEEDSLVFRRHSILQGHIEGAREGRVSMRAATDTSDLTTLPHQKHLFNLSCHSRVGSFHRPRACRCALTGSQACAGPAQGGGKCECQRERGIDECERDQGRFYRPERFLQPIDFGSPFAELI